MTYNFRESFIDSFLDSPAYKALREVIRKIKKAVSEDSD